MTPIHVRTVTLPLFGQVRLAASDRGLCGVSFRDLGDPLTLSRPGVAVRRGAAAHPLLDRFEAELRAYAAGALTRFATPLDLGPLPDFTGRVLEACRAIPFGRLASYGELAGLAGNPRAGRAVGQVMARNPLPIVIPCHRVIASGSRIGGFTPGTGMKRLLLAHEGVECSGAVVRPATVPARALRR